MSTIKLDPEELKNIEGRIANLKNEILSLSGSDGSSGYVKDNLFDISHGESVDAMNKVLKSLVLASENMENIIIRTEDYLNLIIEDFQIEDQTQADNIRGNN